MGFKENKYKVKQPIKLTTFLLQQGYTKAQTQRMIDKRRVRQNGKVLSKSSFLDIGEISIIEFCPKDLGLPILFAYSKDSKLYATTKHKSTLHAALQNINFCILYKPAKLLTHPKKLHKKPSALDQLRYSFGNYSNPCHRLDYETSGILLCGLDKQSERKIKASFAKQEIQKEYFAIIRGALKEPLLIESDILFSKDSKNLCIKGYSKNIHIRTIPQQDQGTFLQTYKKKFIQTDSTKASTFLFPMHYFEDNKQLFTFLDSFNGKNMFAPPFTQNYKVHSYIAANFMEKDVKRESTITHILFNKTLFLDFLAFLLSCQEVYVPTSFLLISSSLQPHSFLMHYHLKQLFSLYKNFTPLLYNAHSSLDSHLESLEQDSSLVKLVPITGKTHQLRIHASSMNHAILGDTLYGINENIASFFLDTQNIRGVLQDLLTSHISFLLQKKDSCGFLDGKKKFISFALSPLFSPCFAQIDLCDKKEQYIFFSFLFFFFSLPFYQNEILKDMRIYYCKNERLLLHAFSLELFGMKFQTHHFSI